MSDPKISDLNELEQPEGSDFLVVERADDETYKTKVESLPGPSSLNDLDDVDAESPSDGDAVVWNDSESRWEPGEVDNEVDDDGNVLGGTADSTSVAAGDTAEAPDSGSVVIGIGAYADRDDTVAIGHNVYADSNTFRSVVIGANAEAGSGSNESVTIGAEAMNGGDRAVAIGQDVSAGSGTLAIGHGADGTHQSMVIGVSASSSHGYTIAIGWSAEVAAGSSGGLAIGYDSLVDADQAQAIGYEAEATHDRSIALGVSIQTTASNQVMIGPCDLEITDDQRGVIVVDRTTEDRVRIYVDDGDVLTETV